ncbi:MAG: hypothetical protein WA892_12990 [Ornithinimicrobium sp.]
MSTARGESVLAAAQDDTSKQWLVLTTYRVVVLDDGGAVGLERPWHEVATGAWDPDSSTLSLSWVGSDRAVQWVLRRLTGPGRIPQVFRERVSASVVQVREVSVGTRRSARISVRSILHSRELIDQVVLGRGSSTTDSELADEVARVRGDVRASVGLPPVAHDHRQAYGAGDS